jgi:hypothetical protein
MDVVGFLYVSLGGRTIQLHGNVGTRRVCACSEAYLSSENGDRVL